MARFLFTTLPTNDLGLVTRGLPIAEGLAERGHEVVFSAPGTAPAAQVAAAGFRNVLPAHPIFDLFHRGAGARGVLRLLASRPRRPGHPGRVATIRQLIAAAPRADAPADEQPWDSDHAAAQMGLSSVGFVRAGATATVELLERLDPDVVVDLWNPFAAIAARASGRRRVSVIQGDAHPASAGFIWWRPRPPETPTPTAAINVVLAELGAEPVGRFVIAPTYSERESNARRIEALGAGIMVPVERTGRHTTISPSQLRDAAMTAIASEAMRGAATELGSHLAGFGGPGTAADVIESAVGRESGPTGG